MDEVGQIRDELRMLSRGPSLGADDIVNRLGTRLKRAFDIGDDDLITKELLREKITPALNSMPGELRAAVEVGLALDDDSPRLLSDRVEQLATSWGRDPRTVRRRMNEGMFRLAAAIAATLESTSRRSPSWHTEAIYALLRLDVPEPVSIERRVVVAEADGIDQVEVGRSRPRHSGEHATAGSDVELLYGGALNPVDTRGPRSLQLELRFPRPLRRGERHEYSLGYTFHSSRTTSQPCYLQIPARPCDLLELRIKFNLASPPAVVWRVDHRFLRDFEDSDPTSGEKVELDRYGEIRQRFDAMEPGRVYGVAWDFSDSDAPFQAGGNPVHIESY